MFAFFVNDIFFGFWQNKKLDIFFENTIQSLSLNASLVDLVFYENVNQPPSHFSFDTDKTLVLQSVFTEVNSVPTLDGNGDQVLDENSNPVFHDESTEVTTTIGTVAPEIYVTKGVMTEPC